VGKEWKDAKNINMHEAVGQENLRLLWDPKFIIIVLKEVSHWNPFRIS
jgi:hypothetical protein